MRMQADQGMQPGRTGEGECDRIESPARREAREFSVQNSSGRDEESGWVVHLSRYCTAPRPPPITPCRVPG